MQSASSFWNNEYSLVHSWWLIQWRDTVKLSVIYSCLNESFRIVRNAFSRRETLGREALSLVYRNQLLSFSLMKVTWCCSKTSIIYVQDRKSLNPIEYQTPRWTKCCDPSREAMVIWFCWFRKLNPILVSISPQSYSPRNVYCLVNSLCWDCTLEWKKTSRSAYYPGGSIPQVTLKGLCVGHFWRFWEILQLSLWIILKVYTIEPREANCIEIFPVSYRAYFSSCLKFNCGASLKVISLNVIKINCLKSTNISSLLYWRTPCTLNEQHHFNFF